MIGRASCLIVALAFCAIAGASETALANQNRQTAKAAEALQNCFGIKDKDKRLVCYDKAARQFAPPTYKGRLGVVTKPFKLDKPHKLRYRSYGVIFVLYLRDENGDVLQNLHIGGGGEDEYIIEKPGVYSLKIHGSTTWEIWLEPIEKPLNH